MAMHGIYPQDMGESETIPCWLPIWAGDLQPGDLIRFTPDGDNIRVADRDYPGGYTPIFRIKLPDGSTTGLAKLARIEIFDPDGSVARRVTILPSR